MLLLKEWVVRYTVNLHSHKQHEKRTKFTNKITVILLWSYEIKSNTTNRIIRTPAIL